MIGKQIIVKTGGQTFRCDCGCNVFTEVGWERFRCNSCGDVYVGEYPNSIKEEKMREWNAEYPFYGEGI